MSAHRLLATLGVVIALTASAPAQEYVTEDVPSLGIKLKIHKKLKPVPMDSGEARNVVGLHQRAKFEPESRQQFIVKAGTPFSWGVDVYLFEKAPTYKNKPKDQAEVRRRAVEKRKFEQMAYSFEHFMTTKDPRSATRKYFGKAGKDGLKVKAKGKTPEHKFYEFANEGQIDESGLKFLWYEIAAAYKLDKDREIAVTFRWPVFKGKPDSKYYKIGKKIVQSLVVDAKAAAAAAASGGGDRDKFADTDAKKEIVAAATQSILGHDGWDYFTTPECAVIYSWKPKSNKQKKARDRAEKVAAHFAALQDKFAEVFPAYEGMPESYPVVSICFDRHTFRQFISPPPPVRSEGFYDGRQVALMDGGDQSLEQLVARYGFRHFATVYFKGAKLSPWFAEGFGDYFAAWNRAGSKWKFAPLKHRIAGKDSVRTLFKKGENASLNEFLRWPDDKFARSEDNETAEKCLGQAYSLADMLIRGEKKLGSKWDAAWSKILPTYIAQMKKTRNASRAEKAAFGAVDAKAFDAAWSTWVSSQVNKK